jgi:hypothetical protein
MGRVRGEVEYDEEAYKRFGNGGGRHTNPPVRQRIATIAIPRFQNLFCVRLTVTKAPTSKGVDGSVKSSGDS